MVSVSGSGQLSWDLKDVQGVARPSSLTQEQVQMRGGRRHKCIQGTVGNSWSSKW